ncbi:CLUMA_CG006520, isoform A [Clunio marinus]|uniref:cGMP-dependent protein kinase n=1 Tax=Clunio marinus TaxID=568069 RepID=A0A1J1HYE5_9DIPT|nr:CLUMA_CG006520, isoform A [Clunio marinus]
MDYKKKHLYVNEDFFSILFDSAVKMITSAIISNDFLCNILDNDSIKTVVGAMVTESFSVNSFIINEGDSGNFLYVSSEGIFEVIKAGNSIKSFGAGVVFGELSILYKAKRFASIKALTNCKVFSLERKVFQKIMMSCGRREREENIKFLSSVSVLKDLPLVILNKISDLLKREYFPAGSTIIRQGDPGDKFYIIRGGSVNVIKSNENGQRLVGILKKGAYFGEQALIHQDKRLASIIANQPGTDCLTLDRKAFDAHLGSLEVIRNTKIADKTFSRDSKASTVSKQDFGHVQLNELKLIGTLGVGGFGRVELVRYKNKVTFALKCLKKIEMLQQQQQQHAYNEKEILFACDSPFIVRLYKTFKDRKFLYYLMEPCLGGDVWTVLQKYKYFDERTSKFMAACVVLALEYLHGRRIIYRDLKPENLMLDSSGYIKLVDFGFAKFIKPGNKTWTFAGTPEYVAPEIILNKGHDQSVDYWSLGILIHELLIGKPPFRGKNQMQTYNQILRGIDCIQLSQRIPRKAQIIIKRLCRQVGTERLGLQKNGIQDIKQHQWFIDFEWEDVEKRKTPAPLIQPVKSNSDLSNFEEYPKDRDETPDEISGWDKNF